MLVVAHRSCPRQEVENSRAGIRRAAVLGADFVEIDVRRTVDGVPVLLHDATPWRTSARVLFPIRWLPSAVVRRLPLRGSDERIPTLAGALAALPAGLGVAIDIKDARAAPATVSAVNDAGLTERVLLWSQHARAVTYCVEHAPTVEVALLRDTFTPADTDRYLADAVRLGARAVSVHWDVLTDELVADAHRRGLTVYSWAPTLDAHATKRGVAFDGVVTDWPEEARAIFA
jgi:glycerophosphoryl diester phosphodiesterase